MYYSYKDQKEEMWDVITKKIFSFLLLVTVVFVTSLVGLERLDMKADEITFIGGVSAVEGNPWGSFCKTFPDRCN